MVQALSFGWNECFQAQHMFPHLTWQCLKVASDLFLSLFLRLAVISNKPHIYIIKTTNEYVNEQDIFANKPTLTLQYS